MNSETKSGLLSCIGNIWRPRPRAGDKKMAQEQQQQQQRLNQQQQQQHRLNQQPQQQQSSRLNRLLTLLDTGSTSATRLTAARQIGEIAKQHPTELQPLLKRIRQFLQSKSWETRVAAAQAVGAIAENVSHATVDLQSPKAESSAQSSSSLAFSSFDIHRVLAFGGVLSGSGGQEYDLVDNSKSPAERIARQKAHLRRLTTPNCSGLDDILDVNEMIRDEDLVMPKPSASGACRGRQEVQQLVANVAPLSRALSAREKNMLKRKAKVVVKDDIEIEEPAAKRTKAVITESQQGDKLILDSVLEEDSGGDGRWSLDRFVSLLMHDMFDPAWEIRHGSIMALREVFSSQGALAAVTAPDTKTENGSETTGSQAAQQPWDFLQDCTLRIICVFALDRFADFVSDQVVAPVRETCAQVLGAVFKQMHPALVQQTLNILLQMQQCAEWEVRHGSLLGIKYLIAVRQEMINDLFLRVLPACQTGLEDPDDDVRAVAAEALIPASNALVSHGGPMLKGILVRLWDILLYLDDLSPSTSSVMNLLAELYSQPEALSRTLEANAAAEAFDLNEVGPEEAEEQLVDLSDLSLLAPRLWPFMRHNISSVRHAAIRTLEKLLEAGNVGNSFWALAILRDVLCLTFQNLLLEVDEAILRCSLRVWRILVQRACLNLEPSTVAFFSSWLKLASTPAGTSLEATSMFSPTSLPRGSRSKAVAKLRSANSAFQAPEAQKNLGVLPRVVVGADSEKSVIHMRVATSSALGILAARVPEGMLHAVVDALNEALSSQSGIQRQVASMVLVTFFKELRSLETKPQAIAAAKSLTCQLQVLLSAADPSRPTPDSAQPYIELARTYAKMRGEGSALSRQAEAFGIGSQPMDGISIEGAIELALKLSTLPEGGNDGTDEALVAARDALESVRQRLLATAGYLRSVQANLHGSVLASLACAVVWMGELPSKLNPVIQPLMVAMKREQEEVLQQAAAESLAEIIAHCVGRKPCPNDKLVKNLCTMACADVQETPIASDANSASSSSDELELLGTVKSSGRKSEEDRARLEGMITRRGAELALKALCDKFDEGLFEKLPRLWDCLTDVIKPSDPAEIQGPSVVTSNADPQSLINNYQLIRAISPFLKGELRSRVLTLLPAIFGGIRHHHAAVRLSAAKCVGSMAKTMKEPMMSAVLSKAMPMLKDTSSVEARQGAGMLVTILVNGLGAELVAYSPLLIVPLLGCMGDNNQAVRQSVTQSFATLVPLLPLARGMPPLSGLSASENSEDMRFLEQLLDNSRVDDYKLAFELAVPLRRYQQEGINWLAFLKRFKLHGILCDDMGLGKTLQASAMVASDTAERALSSEKESNVPLQSLIVCPPTLVGHWAFEIEKFIPSEVLRPLQYVGQPHDRTYLRSHFSTHNVVITSYDVLRKDIDFLSQTVWNFYILDEGHIIKNGKSKVTLAVKQIQAEHRLILSGTPIQNNVLELWSLFDFLMPGFLGTERQFQALYGKPLLAARDAKCSAKDAEAGVFAMEALHKQVMPFLLRRTKDEVLADLPPKIIQDRYCDLCPLQLKLYESFSQSQAKKDVSKLVEAYGGTEDVKNTSSSTHVFQALQYLRKVCSHPLLVLDESDKGVDKTDPTIDLHDIQNSPKLLALKDILEECGIGQGNGGDSPPLVGQHRVLIFAQLKGFLDIIEKDLFKTHMRSVTYLRLDGSVASERRFEIVKAFNSDPTIDVLLLTTHVGGLGLNLTTADTVVFMEHDWNPMRDLQAMDRAHRLGQKRVVNVHRLIMRGTMEEKIMGLQKFKISVANTVINSDNASLNTMDTGQLLDLFTVSGKKPTAASSSKDKDAQDDAAAAGAPKGLKAMLNSLEELWDESLYSEEYNLGQFVARLK